MNFKKFLTTIFLIILTYSLSAEELETDIQSSELNFYTGMFDFSDDGKKSTLIGFQHQNKNLTLNFVYLFLILQQIVNK